MLIMGRGAHSFWVVTRPAIKACAVNGCVRSVTSKTEAVPVLLSPGTFTYLLDVHQRSGSLMAAAEQLRERWADVCVPSMASENVTAGMPNVQVFWDKHIDAHGPMF